MIVKEQVRSDDDLMRAALNDLFAEPALTPEQTAGIIDVLRANCRLEGFEAAPANPLNKVDLPQG